MQVFPILDEGQCRHETDYSRQEESVVNEVLQILLILSRESVIRAVEGTSFNSFEPDFGVFGRNQERSWTLCLRRIGKLEVLIPVKTVVRKE